MPHHEWRPLRKRSPWIGSRPGVFVALPARRPRPALIVAAVTALLPRALPPQPQIGTPRRAAIVTPPVAGSLRAVKVYGGRGRLLLPVVPGTGAAVTLAAGPSGFREALVLRGPPPPARGRVVLTDVPNRTVRLAAFQLDPLVVRRDERRGAGTVFVSKVPDRTVRLAAFQTDALIVRRDARGFAGAVLFPTPHRPTFRLPAGETRALVVALDERRYPGAVFTVKVPARTVRLEPFQTRASVLLRPYPEARRGAVWLGAPHRDTSPRPAKGAELARGLPPPFRGSVFTSKVPDRTVRLDAFQEGARVVQRDERRFAGRVLLGTPSRTGAAVIVPTTAKLAARVVRRDERRFSGAVFTDHVPARTLRLASFQEDALVVRRDERRYAGAVVLTHIPARTVRLTPLALAARVVPPPAREGRRGSLLLGSPHRDTSPKPAKRVLLAAPTPPRPGGSVFTVRVPARTVRLTPVQLTAGKARRDERRFAGRVFLASPSRTGTAVIVPRTPHHLLVSIDRRRFNGAVTTTHVPGRTVRLAPFQVAALLIRRDERRFAGVVTTSHVPSRTVRLDAFQAAALLVRRGERRSAGRVLIGSPSRTAVAVVVPRLPRLLLAGREARGFAGRLLLGRVPSRTLRLIAPELRALLLKRDERRYAGAVLLTPVHRATAPVGAARGALVARQAGAFPAVRPVVLVAPKRRSFVLAPGLTRSHVFTRQSFPPPGAVLWVRPVRPKVVFRIPEAAVIRRDERCFAGRQLTSPVSRQNAVAALLGNPRAKVTRRAGPVATLVLRPAPTATLTLRDAPVGALTLKEG